MTLLLAGCNNSKHRPPTSSLYEQYAMRQDLTVAEVYGFKLNDTVDVDVVILVADDSAAWQGLKEELDIRTSEGVTSWMGNIDNPQVRVKRSELPAWRTMAVHDDRTVAFYRINDDTQYEALLDYQLDNINKE